MPEWIPEPFREIARGCLRWEPQERLSIEKIKTLLERHSPVPETKVQPSVSEAVEEKSEEDAVAAATEPIPAKEEPTPEPKKEERKAAPVPSVADEKEEEYEDEDEDEEDEEEDELFQRPRRFSTLEGERKEVGWLIFIGVAVLVAVAAVMAVRGYWSEFWQSAKNQIAPQSSQPSPQSQAPPEGTGSNQAAQQNPKQHPDQAASQNQPQAPSPQSQDLTPGETPAQNQQPSEQQSTPAPPQPSTQAQTPASPPPSAQTEKQPAAAPETSEPKSEGKAPAPRVSNAKGAVTKRVLPSVASGARESMRRPVEVQVQVSVNERGGVSDATCLTQGPGNYFGRVSVQAAQSWKFQPPVSNGRPQPSSWILRFHFDRSHVEVTATEMK